MAFFCNTVDLDPSTNISNIVSNGSPTDIFVANFDLNGNYIWSYDFGGNNSDYSSIIALDNDNNQILVGFVSSSIVDYDPDTTIANFNTFGSMDMFIAKYSKCKNKISETNYFLCNGDNIFINGNYYDTTRTIYDTLFNANTGCDSIAISNIILVDNTVTKMYTICSNDSLVFNNHVYTVTGIYSDTLTSVLNGCDSIVRTNLNVISFSNNIYQTICQGESFVYNNHFYSTTGVYYDTLASSMGCDSIIIIQLTVDTFPCSLLNSEIHFQWANSIGGMYSDAGNSIVVDTLGNSYVTGYFNGANIDFDNDADTVYLSTNTNDQNDLFFAKYNPNGNLLWAHSIAEQDDVLVSSINIDNTGSIYLLGSFMGVDVNFNPGSFPYLLSSQGGAPNLFFAKYNSNGNLIWVKSLDVNPTFSPTNNKLQIDKQGNIYLAGTFNGSKDFNPGASTYTLNSGNNFSAYFAKYNSNGDFIWANAISGNWYVMGSNIALDGSSNIFLTGCFNGTNVDFDLSSDTAYLSSSNVGKTFIAKYDSAGNYLWVNQINLSDIKSISSICVDKNDNLYLSGYIGGYDTSNFKIDFNPGIDTAYLYSSNYTDIFIAKYNSNGNFKWAKKMGGSNNDQSSSIITDIEGNPFITGYIASTDADFDPSLNSNILITKGYNDVFIAKYDTNGNNLWAKSIGNISNEESNSIAVDNKNNVFITGYFTSTTVDFDPGINSTFLNSNGGSDFFIAKYGIAREVTVSNPQEIFCNNSYVLNGHTYSSTGNYYDTLSSVTGGDSIVVTQLNVLNQFTLKGSVKYDSLGQQIDLKKGEILLFNNQLGNLDTLNVINVNNGVFINNSVKTGSFKILSKPDSLAYYPNLSPVYYINSDNWNNAQTINAFCLDTISLNFIHGYLKPDSLIGGGIISGYVVDGVYYGKNTNLLSSNVSFKADVIIEQLTNEKNIAYTQTNSNGYFRFKNLPDGNYSIKVSIPGKLQDNSTYNFHIQNGGFNYDTTVVFYFNDTLIFIRDTTGLDTINIDPTYLNQFVNFENNLKVIAYPNPVSDGILTIRKNTDDIVFMGVKIYDLNGRLISQFNDLNLINKKITLNLNELNLHEGMFLLETSFKGSSNVLEKSVFSIKVE